MSKFKDITQLDKKQTYFAPAELFMSAGIFISAKIYQAVQSDMQPRFYSQLILTLPSFFGNMIIDLNKKIWQIITLLVLAIIWGSSFILMKRGLESFSNEHVAAYRIFIAFLVLAPVSLVNLHHFKGKFMIPLICSGLLGNAIPAFLFTKAQTVITSSFSGMLNSLTPLLTLLVGVIFFGLSVRWINVIGVIIGLAGAIGLIFNHGFQLSNDNIYGIYVVLATLCYAVSVNIIKKYLKDLNAIIITSLALFCVGPLCGAYLYTTGFLDALEGENSFINFGYINILGIIGTSAGVIIFNFLIKKTSPIFAASVTYIIPVVAIIWGVFDSEQIYYSQILWIAVILAGVYIVNITGRKKNGSQVTQRNIEEK